MQHKLLGATNPTREAERKISNEKGKIKFKKVATQIPNFDL